MRKFSDNTVVAHSFRVRFVFVKKKDFFFLFFYELNSFVQGVVNEGNDFLRFLFDHFLCIASPNAAQETFKSYQRMAEGFRISCS